MSDRRLADAMQALEKAIIDVCPTGKMKLKALSKLQEVKVMASGALGEGAASDTLHKIVV